MQRCADCLLILAFTLQSRESDPRLLAEILIIFPPSALAVANVRVIIDEVDCAYVFHHRETKLCLHAQAERRSVVNRKLLAIRFVGKNRLRIHRQIDGNHAVET